MLFRSGNGNIPAFTALNTDTTVQIATITVLAFQTLNGLTCQTDSQQFTISVNPVATMVSINNSTVCAGAIVSSIDFSSNVSSQAVRYDWHNNDTTIGLSARGSGAIPSFTATNNGQNPIIATITVTLYITTNGLDCAGNTINFTITVNPQVAMAAVTNQVLCAGSSSNAITFASTNSGGTIRYEWNNDNTSIGLAATGNGSIPSFTTVNGTTAPVTATITVTPYFTADGVECSGIAQTFTITVLPTVTMNALQNQTTCHNEIGRAHV